MDFLRRTPLLGVLAALVAGILAASFFDGVAPWAWAVCCAVCFFVAIAALWSRSLRSRPSVPQGRMADANLSSRGEGSSADFWAAWVYVGLATVFFGAFVGRVSVPQSVVPQGVRLSLDIVLDERPTWRGGRAMHTSGRLVPSGERLLVSFDTAYRFALGDRIRFTGYVNPIDSVSSGYARLMRARGFTGRTYISQYSAPQNSADEANESLRAHFFFKKLQSSATERLSRLGLPADELAVAAAMTTGWRGASPGLAAGMSHELRTAYSRTGAAHLLAVSGLHVGIIFLIINGLLYLLPFVRGGRILKNILAVAAIWGYAALTGMSASVMRAATMFTGAQVAVALSVTRSPANILCGTAVVLLSFGPGLVFDIGFQLSFLAVAGIMCWFSALYRCVESRWKLLNALWSTLVVGFSASVATMPLVSHTFGVISPLGVLLNPILMFTAWVVVAFSAAWILVPLGFLVPVFRWIVGGAAELQNAVVQSVSSVPGVALEFRLSGWGVFAIYGALIMLTIRLKKMTDSGRHPERVRRPGIS